MSGSVGGPITRSQIASRSSATRARRKIPTWLISIYFIGDQFKTGRLITELHSPEESQGNGESSTIRCPQTTY